MHDVIIRFAPDGDRPVQARNELQHVRSLDVEQVLHPMSVRRKSVAAKRHPRVVLDVENLVPGERLAYLRSSDAIGEQPQNHTIATTAGTAMSARLSPLGRSLIHSL